MFTPPDIDFLTEGIPVIPPSFILVTMNPDVRMIVPIADIQAVREPLPKDELIEGTKCILMVKGGINLFVLEDMDYFLTMMKTSILRRSDA